VSASQHDPEPEGESEEESAGGPQRRQQPVDLVRLGLWFYGGMAFVAVVWRAGIYGEPMFYTSVEAEAQGVSLISNGLLGLLVGACVVGISYVFTKLTGWGDRLARELARAIGPMSVPDALLMAAASGFSEELLFRGAVQPRMGLLAASVLFGAMHFVPRREMLPWTGFAIVVGLVLGWIFESTGNLVAPMVAHAVVNAVNLPLLTHLYGEQDDEVAEEEPP
jgi:membrane protease YdiL (CAAX protease family)